MKLKILIALIFVSVYSEAQTVRANDVIADRNLYAPVYDTIVAPGRVGDIRYRVQDSALYTAIKTASGGRRWAKLTKSTDIITSATPSFQAVTSVGNTTTRDISFDTTATIGATEWVTKRWIGFEPLVKGEGNESFSFNQVSARFGAGLKPDESMAWGWNIEGRGEAEDATKPSIYYQMEQDYVPGISGSLTEAHLIWRYPGDPTAGTRLTSYYLDNITLLSQQDNVLSSVNFHSPTDYNNIYLAFSSGGQFALNASAGNQAAITFRNTVAPGTAALRYLDNGGFSLDRRILIYDNVKSPTFTAYGSTSGEATIVTAAIAGNPTITLPTTTGTLALTASPTFTGTVTIPSPFTLGATSVTTTGAQLNYLASATGTTGTTSSNVVFSTSPTLITPDLGTPSAAILTNATGLPISTGVSGLGTGVSSFLATPSSANLAAAITDETGTGAAVFGTSPTFTTGITTPLIVGNAGTTTPVNYKVTTGVGAVGADHVFLTGNNGATTAMKILNSGDVNIGLPLTTNVLSTSSYKSLTLNSTSPGRTAFQMGINGTTFGYMYAGPAADFGENIFVTSTAASNISLVYTIGGVGEMARFAATTGNLLIGTTTDAASAKVNISSTTKGALLPRMTKAQRDAISSPATGLIVYQTDNTPGLRCWNGTNWMRYTETAD